MSKEVKFACESVHGVRLGTNVLGRTYDVIEVDGNRVAIGVKNSVTAAMDIKNLELA